MPITYARSLTGRDRTARANQHLGFVLAFVAGAINAGGFLAVGQYTSHMTGIVSAMADNLVLGSAGLVRVGAGALTAFVAGAACSAILINFGRRKGLHSEYAFPLLVEAALLLLFGVLGARLANVDGLTLPLAVLLLCFMMGLQNAVITKISGAEVRTTHVTGVVTDIGIELGKMLYWNSPALESSARIQADPARLRMLTTLVASFFLGGFLGAYGFQQVGYTATIPLAMILIVLASVPAWDDLVKFARPR